MKKIKPRSQRSATPLLKLRRTQRSRLQEELFWLSAFLTEWFWQKIEMKNAKQYNDPEYRESRWQKIRIKMLGAPGQGDGLLQKRINDQMEDILKRLKADMPYLPETEYFAYSYFVAGFDNLLVAHLLGLPSAKIASSMKSRLKDEFLIIKSPNKFEYLEVLPQHQLPIWQRNAIFA